MPGRVTNLKVLYFGIRVVPTSPVFARATCCTPGEHEIGSLVEQQDLLIDVGTDRVTAQEVMSFAWPNGQP